MLDLKTLRESAMREGMKLMGNPRVMKLMQDPRFMKVMMRAFQLRGDVQGKFDKRAKQFAKTFKLATRDEVEQLKSTLRTLERSLKQVEARTAPAAAVGAEGKATAK